MSNTINVSYDESNAKFYLSDPDTSAVHAIIDACVINDNGFISLESVEKFFLEKVYLPHKDKLVYVGKALETIWARLDFNCAEDNWVE